MPFGTIILNDGYEIPQIAFGTGTALYDNKDSETYITQALEGGFSQIDTAETYANERSVGLAIRATGLSRSELFITTKYGGGGPIREELEKSLRKLGLTYVDLFLIHWPQYVNDIPTAWREFENLRADGLAKSIGVSNFSIQELELLLKDAKVIPAVNQIQFHPYNYAENIPMLDFAAKHGITIEAYSSLTPITKVPGGPVDAVIQTIGARIGATPAQVILSWVKSKGIVIVTTTSKKERLQEYLNVADLPALTKEDVQAIEVAGAKGPGMGLWKAVGNSLVSLTAVIVAVKMLFQWFIET